MRYQDITLLAESIEHLEKFSIKTKMQSEIIKQARHWKRRLFLWPQNCIG